MEIFHRNFRTSGKRSGSCHGEENIILCVTDFRKVKLPWGNFPRAIYHSVTPNMKVINNQS